MAVSILSKSIDTASTPKLFASCFCLKVLFKQFSASGQHIIKVSHSGTNRLGSYTFEPAELSGKRVDFIDWRIQYNIDYTDAPLAVRQPHSPDDISAKLMQYGIDFGGSIEFFYDDRNHCNTRFRHRTLQY